MIYQPTHSIFELDPFYSNRIIEYKARFFSNNILKKFFSRQYLKSKFIIGLNKDLGKILMMLEGFKLLLENDKNISIDKEYDIIEKALKKFIKIHSLFESAAFFNNATTEDISTKIMHILYDIEYEFRQKKYADVSAPDSDKELQKVASIISFKTALSQSDAV